MILNDVKIIGNLVNDPEVRFTPKGTPVANLSLGINETYRSMTRNARSPRLLTCKSGVPAPKISASSSAKARKSLSKALSDKIAGKINRPAKTVQSST